MKRISLLFLACVATMCLQRCSVFGDKISTPVKTHPNDPFNKTMVPSQKFTVDAEQDNVVSGKEGVTLVMPKGCFVDEHGVVENGKVDIELAEALTRSDMILANLTTMSNGQPLVTGGMFYFSITKDGKQLGINKALPVHVEVPTHNRLGGMQVYKGIRDTAGNMNWVDPKPIENYLQTVDINGLNFLPRRFFGGEASFFPLPGESENDFRHFVDSFYYSFSEARKDGLQKLKKRLIPNEPYYTRNWELTQYPEPAYDTTGRGRCHIQYGKDYWHWGVDPAFIKPLKSEKFQNTFIATRAFESRLQAIFQSGENKILNLYIDNLDKKLYEVDSLVVVQLNSMKSDSFNDPKVINFLIENFEWFKNERLLKVKDADRYSELAKKYYQQELAVVNRELSEMIAKYKEGTKEDSPEKQKAYQEYSELLMKREKYRMEKYGFELTETGWVNVDNGTIAKNWSNQSLQVKVLNGKNYGRVYAYVQYESIKSLYRFNTDDNIDFYVGNAADKSMLIPNKSGAAVFVIGYKNDSPAYCYRKFTTGESDFTLTLKDTSSQGVKLLLEEIDYFSGENSISHDLEYMYILGSGNKDRSYRGLIAYEIDYATDVIFPRGKPFREYYY